MKQLGLVAMMVMVLSLLGGTAAAEHPATPSSLNGAMVVDSEWVKANLKKTKIVDVRKKAEYVEGHLPGAVLIPYKENSEKKANFDASKDELDLSKFPSDKNEPIVAYCNGEKCWKSYKTAKRLVSAGYTKVYWYRDGYPAWKAKGFPVE